MGQTNNHQRETSRWPGTDRGGIGKGKNGVKSAGKRKREEADESPTIHHLHALPNAVITVPCQGGNSLRPFLDEETEAQRLAHVTWLESVGAG